MKCLFFIFTLFFSDFCFSMKNEHINLSTALQKDFAQMIYSEKTTVADVKHFIHTQTRSPVTSTDIVRACPYLVVLRLFKLHK
ncbi:hypothetical protein IPH67_05610 [bacterium]|nr:MAG: hypothetical protein IPH67_05610 [bacterium]